MDEAWDWVEQELKKIQNEIPADAEMMQVVDAISVADFWKRRYDEERMLWERKLELKEDERQELQGKAQGHEASIKELDWKFKELEHRWEKEKLLLEDRLKTKEIESSLEKAQLQWEARIKALEDENKTLKVQLGVSEGVALTPQAVLRPAGDAGPVSREREEVFRKSEAEALRRLEKLETEKRDVAASMQEKEKLLADEREKWTKLERELNAMSAQMTRQLNGLKEREEEHFVILEDLARGFAHRVRNYLGIISGTIQLSLVNFKMEGELEEQLKIVDQNVQDMLKSIEEFLALARIPEMSLGPVNINQVLESVSAATLARLQAPNVTIDRNLDPSLPLPKCDQKMIEDVFRYLIENAIEALPQGGQVRLATAYDRERGTLSVKIVDNGAGISETHIKKVFQPYFSSKKNHRGLGLTTAKRIVDLHRGTLALESTKGKGTTATVNFFIDTAAHTA